MPDPRPPRARARLLEARAFDQPVRVLAGRYLDHRFRPHEHDEYTLGVVEEGALGYRADRREHRAGPGSVAVIAPCRVHDGHTLDPDGFRYRVLYLHPGIVRTVLGRDELALPEGVSDDSRSAAILRRAHRDLIAGWDTRLGREEALASLLAGLRSRTPAPDDPGSAVRGVRPRPVVAAEPALRRVAERLADRPDDSPGLDELARDAGMSRRHLTRRFRAAHGLTVHQYQMQAKVRAACERLVRGAPLARVAAELGFADQSHLTRWCWRVLGAPPGRLREDASTSGARRIAPTDDARGDAFADPSVDTPG